MTPTEVSTPNAIYARLVAERDEIAKMRTALETVRAVFEVESGLAKAIHVSLSKFEGFDTSSFVAENVTFIETVDEVVTRLNDIEARMKNIEACPVPFGTAPEEMAALLAWGLPRLEGARLH